MMGANWSYDWIEMTKDKEFYARAYWKLTFCWLPVRSDVTNKIIWLTKAYRGSTTWFGIPSEPVVEARWRTQQEHLTEILKGHTK